MFNFEAGTQYGDWKGTVAADEYGDAVHSLSKVFEATGKVDIGKEVLVGVDFYIGEGYFSITGYYHEKSQSPDVGGWIPTLNSDFLKEKGPFRVRAIRAEITQEQLFENLKRFNVVLARRGLDILGREFEIIEEV